jgi:hypothetical protein
VSVDPSHGASESFVSEPITPEKGSFLTDLMAQGLAALPGAFEWRGERYQITECLEHHRETSGDGSGTGGGRYLRRQVFRVRLDSGAVATLYVLRQAPRGASRKAAKNRWFLYSLASSGGAGMASASENRPSRNERA